MNFYESFKQTLFKTSQTDFKQKALALFDYQYHTNEVYQSYCKNLNTDIKKVNELSDIPFLPIEFFKNFNIKSDKWTEEKIFLSSGTTSSTRSRHLIRELDFFHETAKKCYEKIFGSLSEIKLIALLPSYQQQGNSSLIAMIDHFMKFTKRGSGYLSEKDSEFKESIVNSSDQLIFGVSYALLDLIQKNNISMSHSKIMETGGMKGRKKEMIRKNLHEELKKGFGVIEIYSEYGMTELTSQAYSVNDGYFQFPFWAKAIIRDINDPFTILEYGKLGGINIIDLANISTCAFIETKDLGRALNENYFTIEGRFDNSDIRGCNLLVS